jgi:hypothetical protein
VTKTTNQQARSALEWPGHGGVVRSGILDGPKGDDGQQPTPVGRDDVSGLSESARTR